MLSPAVVGGQSKQEKTNLYKDAIGSEKMGNFSEDDAKTSNDAFGKFLVWKKRPAQHYSPPKINSETQSIVSLL
jgi:hypothetical protein